MVDTNHIVIIGNGISGVTTARHIRKRSKAKITIISGETKYFYSRTALMYVFMGHMQFEHTQPYENNFWPKNNIDLIFDWVTDIDYSKKELKLKNGDTVSFDQLVLATGSKSNKFGWPGQDLPGVQGLYNFQDLEQLEQSAKTAKRAVIIGGGLIGIEFAEMMISRGIEVTFLVRESSFWSNVLPPQESELITRHIRKHHVDLQLNTELKEIVAGKDGRVSKIITSKGQEIECQIVGLTAGVSPNIDFLKGSDLKLDRGILVNQYLETNIPDVYALGDCAQFHESINDRRNIEQVWYTGRMMGESLAKTITGTKTPYNPGNWFNSAKFFDVEYQTYGWVFADLKEGEKDFYWEHPKGEIAMHFVFREDTHAFVGVNTFGIRLRHHAFDKWLDQGKTIEYILEHLADANFDPEFYKHYEQEVIKQFNLENGTSLNVKSKNWTRILSFMK